MNSVPTQTTDRNTAFAPMHHDLDCGNGRRVLDCRRHGCPYETGSRGTCLNPDVTSPETAGTCRTTLEVAQA